MTITGSIIRQVVAPLWAWKEGTPYLRYLKQIEAMKRRPIDLVNQENWQRFRKIVAHAYENTDYFRNKMEQEGLTPQDIKSPEDIVKIPILTKDDIRANKEAMIARNVSQDKLVAKKTSGSTGVALELFIDEASAQWKRAVTLSYDRWSGWDIGERVGAIWGNPEYKQNWRLYLRNQLLQRHVYLDTLKMDEGSMLEFYRKLEARPPRILFGHAHSLFLFAKFLSKNNYLSVKPQGIISTCMVLHDFERQTIEQVFGCKVTNRYGCEEVSLIACECPAHNGMHLNSDTLIVEFIRDGKPVSVGEPGAIVVTDLTNFGMPIIRYKVGDIGIQSSNPSCPCGCTYPLMESIEGRVADYVITPEGNFISGISLTENFAMHLPGLKQMQIVQEEIDYLHFRVVKGENFTEKTFDDLSGLVEERFGNNMRFTIEYVDSVQSEESGKYRFCISKIPNPFC